MEDQSEYPNEVQALYYGKLKWCGCGRPEAVLAFLRDVLQAISDFHTAEWGTPELEAALAREMSLLPSDNPLALGFRYMLDALGLTEHGGSIFGAWLTEEGRYTLSILTACEDFDVAMEQA
jgi:hypothetical protein